MERNELCWCGSGKKYKRCHMAMEEKMEQLREAGHIVPGRELLKTPAQIEAIKKSAELNTAVLDHVAKHIHAGISTEDIDVLVHDFTVSHGGIPAPLGYEGFPKSVCTSLNNEICHGIPDKMSSFRKEISSMSTSLQSLTVTFQMRPECLKSEPSANGPSGSCA